MKRAWFGRIIFCALVATLGCRKPLQDWNGTWKLDSTKSSYQGPVFTISISADGEYRYDDGNSSFVLHCDGKERSIGNNRTRVCIRRGLRVLDITQQENGVKTRATRWELSTDDNVFTSTVADVRLNGPVIASHQIIFSRLSGSNGFAGKWRDTSYLQQHADMTLRLDKQVLHIDYPSTGRHIDAPINGVEVVVHGANAPEGTTRSVRASGSHEFLVVTKQRGKVLTQGSLKLSQDGRSITDSWWSPDQPDAKTMLVYEK